MTHFISFHIPVNHYKNGEEAFIVDSLDMTF